MNHDRLRAPLAARLALTCLCVFATGTFISGCSAPTRVEREVVVVQQPAPPALLAETPPAPPGYDYYWVHGHWRWDGRQYAWVTGHWTQSREGEVLVRASWELEGGRWVYHGEHWQRVAPPSGYVEIVAPNAPPPPRIEVITVAPSPNHFWVNGHWHWDGHRYDWEPGHWELHRAGYVYASPHWVRAGGGFRYYGGYWGR